MWEDSVTIEFASSFFEIVKKASWDDIHPEDSIRENRVSINMPVGDTVSNEETLKVNLLNIFVDDGFLVVLVNLP